MIVAKNLVKIYRKRKVLNNVNIKVEKGEIVGLLGPNGAGKTTTFYIIAGLIFPDSGEVFFNDKKINSYTMYERAKIGITYLPQEPSIFRKLTVFENILTVLEITKGNKKGIEQEVEEILEEFGLYEVRNSKGYEISGGERRRVEIARALILDPNFILLDEPFSGIDPIVVNDLQTMIKNLKQRNIGILISDHNVRETLKICDRAYILNKGEILEEGDRDTITKSEKARNIYLGKEFSL